MRIWQRPATTALIRPLAWEPPYAVGVDLEKAKRQKDKKKKKKKKKKRKKNKKTNIYKINKIKEDRGKNKNKHLTTSSV